MVLRSEDPLKQLESVAKLSIASTYPLGEHRSPSFDEPISTLPERAPPPISKVAPSGAVLSSKVFKINTTNALSMAPPKPNASLPRNSEDKMTSS